MKMTERKVDIVSSINEGKKKNLMTTSFYFILFIYIFQFRYILLDGHNFS